LVEEDAHGRNQRRLEWPVWRPDCALSSRKSFTAIYSSNGNTSNRDERVNSDIAADSGDTAHSDANENGVNEVVNEGDVRAEEELQSEGNQRVSWSSSPFVFGRILSKTDASFLKRKTRKRWWRRGDFPKVRSHDYVVVVTRLRKCETLGARTCPGT